MSSSTDLAAVECCSPLTPLRICMVLPRMARPALLCSMLSSMSGCSSCARLLLCQTCAYVVCPRAPGPVLACACSLHHAGQLWMCNMQQTGAWEQGVAASASGQVPNGSGDVSALKARCLACRSRRSQVIAATSMLHHDLQAWTVREAPQYEEVFWPNVRYALCMEAVASCLPQMQLGRRADTPAEVLHTGACSCRGPFRSLCPWPTPMCSSSSRLPELRCSALCSHVLASAVPWQPLLRPCLLQLAAVGAEAAVLCSLGGVFHPGAVLPHSHLSRAVPHTGKLPRACSPLVAACPRGRVTCCLSCQASSCITEVLFVSTERSSMWLAAPKACRQIR